MFRWLRYVSILFFLSFLLMGCHSEEVVDETTPEINMANFTKLPLGASYKESCEVFKQEGKVPNKALNDMFYRGILVDGYIWQKIESGGRKGGYVRVYFQNDKAIMKSQTMTAKFKYPLSFEDARVRWKLIERGMSLDQVVKEMDCKGYLTSEIYQDILTGEKVSDKAKRSVRQVYTFGSVDNFDDKNIVLEATFVDGKLVSRTKNF